MDANELISMKLPVDPGSLWLPTSAESTTGLVDDPFWFIMWVSLIAFILTMGPMFYFMFKYKRKQKGQKALSQKDHSIVIEIIWSTVPFIFFAYMFYIGMVGFMDQRVAPDDTMQINVRGSQWSWEFVYSEDSNRNLLPQTAKVSGTDVFVVPAGRPVKLIMTSSDVIHSFFVPNFRKKMDVVPGRYTTLWFDIDEKNAAKMPADGIKYKKDANLSKNEKIIYDTLHMEGGEYPIFCTEYCGRDHSRMLSMIKVVPAAQYDAWVKAKANPGGPSLKRGEKVVKGLCLACHNIDGSKTLGPSFKNIYMRKGTTVKGAAYVADDAYIKESILEPNRKVVKGFPAAMSPQSLDEDEIQSVILYMKSISEKQ